MSPDQILEAMRKMGSDDLRRKIDEAMQRNAERAVLGAVTAQGNADGLSLKSGQAGIFRVAPSVHEQLRVRLRLADLGELGLKIQIIEDSDAVFVFVVKDGNAAVLQDTAELFPSDQLVSQLRMLAK